MFLPVQFQRLRAVAACMLCLLQDTKRCVSWILVLLVHEVHDQAVQARLGSTRKPLGQVHCCGLCLSTPESRMGRLKSEVDV